MERTKTTFHVVVIVVAYLGGRGGILVSHYELRKRKTLRGSWGLYGVLDAGTDRAVVGGTSKGFARILKSSLR